MMTIKNVVKQALTQIAGNKPFAMLTVIYHTDPLTLETPLTVDQVRRALRDIPYVRKLTDGRYVVKGRKVPATSAPKPVVIVKCNSCHKFATRTSRIDQEIGICGRCAQAADRKLGTKSTQFTLDNL